MTEPLKILITANTRWWNAEAHYGVNLAQGLIQAGHQATLLLNPDSLAAAVAKKRGLPVIESIDLDSPSFIEQFRNYARLKKLIKERDFDLVNSLKSNGSLWFSFLRKGKFTYIKTRGEARPPKKHFLNRWLYGPKGCDGVIAVGRGVRGYVQALTGEDQKVRVIHYGAPEVETNGEPLEFELPNDKKILLLLGRTQDVKGHKECLKAFSKINNREAHLLFLVKDPEEFPVEMMELKQNITRFELEGKVTVAGHCANLGGLLERVYMTLVPSLGSEVNCRVTVESFSKGVPVLAFPVGSLPDVVKHEKNGWLCGTKTVEALTLALSWALNHRNEVKEMGLAARKDYFERYSLEAFTEKTLEFYREVMEK